jgi:hypothetical protein
MGNFGKSEVDFRWPHQTKKAAKLALAASSSLPVNVAGSLLEALCQIDP